MKDTSDIMKSILPPDLLPQDSNMPSGGGQPDGSQPAKPMGLFDHIAFALLGTPDAGLVPADLKAREQRRSQVANVSANEANSKTPGAEYMKAPGASGGGSKDGGIDLSSIIKLVGSLFGG